MLSIKMVTPAEVGELIPLLTRLYPAIDRETVVSRLSEVAKSDWECIALRDGGQIVGLSGFRVTSRICYGRFLYIDHFIIDDDRQSSGLAKTLLDKMVSISRERHCEYIILDTFVTNSRAQHFWMKGGFKIIGFHFQKALS